MTRFCEFVSDREASPRESRQKDLWQLTRGERTMLMLIALAYVACVALPLSW